MNKLIINPTIFREYDIRGTVDKDLSADFAYLLGRAYATLAKENNKNKIGVGYDARISSPVYAAALARGLNDEGLDCVLTGMGPTPQLYYSIFSEDLGGGIQVTGSHNPPDMNGFKICLGTQTLSGADIQDLKQRVIKVMEQGPPKGTAGKIIDLTSIRNKYSAELISNSKAHIGKRKLKVVVDAGNGVGGLVGPTVLKALGIEVIELFCEPDGRFPNHHPDPTVLENLHDLIKTVRENKADIGIGWDGDADRIGAVDEKGNIIFGDMLLLIFAREILKSVPKATIIGDVKCSARLFNDLQKRGANVVMWKTGHSLIKGKLKELNGELGGEMSGHIFFKHRYYGFDDAIYATLRLCEILSNFSGPASALIGDLPKAISTPEIRVDCAEEIKFKIADAAKAAFSEYKVETIDGVRITFNNGWALVRASNTQPVLVMRFEADNEQHLSEYQELVTTRIEQIKNQLT